MPTDTNNDLPPPKMTTGDELLPKLPQLLDGHGNNDLGLFPAPRFASMLSMRRTGGEPNNNATSASGYEAGVLMKKHQQQLVGLSSYHTPKDNNAGGPPGFNPEPPQLPYHLDDTDKGADGQEHVRVYLHYCMMEQKKRLIHFPDHAAAANDDDKSEMVPPAFVLAPRLATSGLQKSTTTVRRNCPISHAA